MRTWVIALGLGALSGGAALAEEPYRIREFEITDADRSHWAYKPLVRPEVPAVRDAGRARNPIDRFILARQEEAGVESMPVAGRRTLIRRLSFGLTGLPPTPEEAEAFDNDASPTAYEDLVDRLLGGPAYGERWAQHWLDLARFAETDGYEFDKVRKEAWRYRDWVIDALNRDLPYDRFVRLQIAGDEIAPDARGTHVATGFLVSGPDMPDVNRVEERRHVVLNEMASAVGSVFMGLTLECAQCHDHKFDSFSQADFYRFRALFNNTLSYLKKDRQLDMTVREPGPDAPDAHFMIRGDFQRPGPAVEPAFLRVANLSGQKVDRPDPAAKSSMRRRALAEWLTRPDHPLTARVIVNRVWMHHFGKGLVNTPSDFGVMGSGPTHPELLDWLATELIRTGWSLKRLHRLIVTSHAYMQAGRPGDPSWDEETRRRAERAWQAARAKDPANELIWRKDRIRLDGEAIRDAMLLCTGGLNSRRGGPGVQPPLPKEVVETLLKNQWVVSPDVRDHARRSVYVFARRNLRFPIFEAFDRPDANTSCPRRQTSTTAPQALILLNSEFSTEMAHAMSAKAAGQSDELAKQVRLCFETVLCRPPTAGELEASLAFLDEQARRISRDAADAGSSRSVQQSVLADLCLALFNLNEFAYVD